MPMWQGNPMGDAKNDDLRVSFDRRLKLKFLGSKVTFELERPGRRPELELTSPGSKKGIDALRWSSSTTPDEAGWPWAVTRPGLPQTRTCAH